MCQVLHYSLHYSDRAFYGPSVPYGSGYLSRTASVRWDDWGGGPGSSKGGAAWCPYVINIQQITATEEREGQQCGQERRSTEQLTSVFKIECPKVLRAQRYSTPNYC